MGDWKMADVIVRGGSGFAFGHWNLSRGIRERQEQRHKQNPNRDNRKDSDAKRDRVENSKDAKE